MLVHFLSIFLKENKSKYIYFKKNVLNKLRIMNLKNITQCKNFVCVVFKNVDTIKKVFIVFKNVHTFQKMYIAFQKNIKYKIFM